MNGTKGAKMARIKMLRDDKGCRAENPGQVETFVEGNVYEVDDALAEAFVDHMGAATPTDEPVTVELEIPEEPRPLTMHQAPVMDLAAMAASVADMLKGQFAADIASIGERLELIEETVKNLEDAQGRIVERMFDSESAKAALERLGDEMAKIRADHDALRNEFDEAIDADEPAKPEAQAAKPKGAK